MPSCLTVPSFPDYWAFPGGGVSRVEAALEHTEWFANRIRRTAALVALMREMVEEVGIAPGTNGMQQIDAELRLKVLQDKGAWISWLIQNKSVFKTKALWSLANGRHHHLLHCDFEIIFSRLNAMLNPLNVGEDLNLMTTDGPPPIVDEWRGIRFDCPTVGHDFA